MSLGLRLKHVPGFAAAPGEATAMSSSNRRYPRIPAEHVVMVRVQGSRPFEEFARTRTLGIGGCMFVSAEPLGHGDRLELSISLAGRVLRADSRVVYENEQGRQG